MNNTVAIIVGAVVIAAAPFIIAGVVWFIRGY
jgi:hypothetical protein